MVVHLPKYIRVGFHMSLYYIYKLCSSKVIVWSLQNDSLFSRLNQAPCTCAFGFSRHICGHVCDFVSLNVCLYARAFFFLCVLIAID